MGTLMTALWIIAACIVLPLAVFLLLPLILAQITVWRGKYEDQNFRSSLYIGRVWHTRHLPTKHAFQYPLFIFALDLEETEDELFEDKLWPLSIIANLRGSDHLKNGEGREEQAASNTLRERIYRLVAEKTDNRFQPTEKSHRVVLITHLCYYGYCFNPVSFYYLLDRTSGKTDAVVAEVSNTPWNEMYCYVLHPQSTQIKTVQKTQDGSINYVFPKAFHVSPFMEMDYNYDWIFDHDLYQKDSIHVVTAMKRGDTLQFSATMHVHRKGLHPYRVAWQLGSYPIYCLIIQIWIHYEAFWLFYKGVTFQPHPEGAETTASKIIGTLMTPFFAAQAWIEERRSKKQKKDV